MSITAAIDVTGQPAKQADTNSRETAAPAVDTTAKPEDAIAPRLAALARREKQIRHQAQERAKAWESEKKALMAEVEEARATRAWKAKLKTNPLEALNEEGLSYDQLTEAAVNQADPRSLELQKLKAEIQALKDSQTQSKTQAEEAADRSYQEAKKQIGNEVKLLVDGNEEFEAIQTMGMHDMVVNYIEEVYKTEGNLIDVTVAAREVEAELFAQAQSIGKMKKLQPKVEPAAPSAAAPQKTDPAPRQTPTQTLSNRAMAAPAKPTSEKERKARAIAAFMGQQIN